MYIKYTGIYYPLLIIFIFLACRSDEKIRYYYDTQYLFEISELTEDFEVLRIVLEEIHPGMNRYTPKERMDFLFDSLYSQIHNEMTEFDFFKFISPIITEIRCGHTNISPSDNFTQYNAKKKAYFPMQLKFIEGKAYVLKSFSTHELVPPGSEIYSINDRPVSSIIDKIFSMIPSDGNIRTAKYKKLDEDFSELYFQCIGPYDEYKIEYLPYDEEVIMENTYPGVSINEVWDHKSSYMSRQCDPLKFSILDQQNVAILTIVTFIPSIINNNFGNFYEFIDSTFTLLNNNKISNLIIDIRGNNGGDEHYFNHVLSKMIDVPYRIYDRIDIPKRRCSSLSNTDQTMINNIINLLAYKRNEKTGRFELRGKSGWHQLNQPAEPHYNGKVYILIDGWTFSAASDFCALAHFNAHDKITFIGEETGGAYYGNNSGDWINLTLPNTLIEVSIPARYYLLSVANYPEPDRGIIPDIDVSPTIEEILNNVDTPLVRAFEEIRKRQVSHL